MRGEMVAAAVAAAVVCSGCQGILQARGGYTRALTGDLDRQGFALDVHAAVGRGLNPRRLELEHSPLLLDVSLLRLRVHTDGGRMALPSIGGLFWVGEPLVAAAYAQLGASLFDFGWSSDDGFGMFSPYLELGGLLWLSPPFSVTLNAGLEYPVRFSGDGNELIFTATVGIGIAALH